MHSVEYKWHVKFVHLYTSCIEHDPKLRTFQVKPKDLFVICEYMHNKTNHDVYAPSKEIQFNTVSLSLILSPRLYILSLYVCHHLLTRSMNKYA